MMFRKLLLKNLVTKSISTEKNNRYRDLHRLRSYRVHFDILRGLLVIRTSILRKFQEANVCYVQQN